MAVAAAIDTPDLGASLDRFLNAAAGLLRRASPTSPGDTWRRPCSCRWRCSSPGRTPGRTRCAPPTRGRGSRRRGIAAAFLVGAGMNGILPARGGDALKIVLAKRSVERSSYPAIISSFAVLAPFDTAIGIARAAVRDHPGPAARGAAAPAPAGLRDLLLGRASGAADADAHACSGSGPSSWSRSSSRRVESFWQRLKQGVAIFREPPATCARWPPGSWSAGSAASPRSGSSSTPSTSAARSTTCSW